MGFLAPLEKPLSRGQQSVSVGRPAPTKGWVAYKNLADMRPDEAIQLDNIVPGTDNVYLRGGSSVHVSGLGGAVKSLFNWSGRASSKMVAGAGGKLWDATSEGSPSELGSGYANDIWQGTNFSNVSGNSYLYLVNGDDSPVLFDGTSLSTPSLTGSGLTTSNLVHVGVHKGRVWFVEKASMNLWYLPTSSISGTLSKFDMAPFFKDGGYIVATATWSRDGGNGPDDYFVIVTSEGQVAIYQGTDPASGATWALVGIFKTGRPLGRRCMLSLAGDVIISTQDGHVPCSKILRLERADVQRAAISKNINPVVTKSAELYGENFGWQGVFYPKKQWIVFNVPIAELSSSHQHVCNAQTFAWGRLKEWNANCFEVYEDDLYFGDSSGNVVKADTGTSDRGEPIMYTVRAAFDYFGERGQNKLFTQVRPVLVTDGDASIGVGVDVDFGELGQSFPVSLTSSGASWDVTDWDTALWSNEKTVVQNWKTVNAWGRCASFKFTGSTATSSIALQAIDWQFVPGAPQ